jgi:hypothetical protein
MKCYKWFVIVLLQILSLSVFLNISDAFFCDTELFVTLENSVPGTFAHLSNVLTEM